MNSGDGLDFQPSVNRPNLHNRGIPRRDAPHDFLPGMSKVHRNRVTEHTEDRNSDRSQSYYVQYQPRRPEQSPDLYSGQSRVTHSPGYGSEGGIRFLSEKEEKVVQLRERLKNIHHFYRIRIEEERTKNIERNEIFIGIIQQLQRSHSERLIACRRGLEEMEEEKNELGYVDQRMGSIKTTIEEILAQSKDLKIANQRIQKQLLSKEAIVKSKEAEFIQLKSEADTLRDSLEQFERLKLKQNKRSKELLEMIDQAQK